MSEMLAHNSFFSADVPSDFSKHIRINFLLVWALARIIEAIHCFRVWLLWKILIGYSQLYTPDENKQVRYMHIAYY